MNKKGFMGILSLIITFTLLVLGLCLITNDSLSEIGKGPTILNLSWTPVSQTAVNDNIYANQIITFIYSFINFIGYWIMEFANFVSVWASQHPEINGKVLISLVILMLLTPLIYPVFLIIISLSLIIKELFTTRNERKRYLNEKELKKGGKKDEP